MKKVIAFAILSLLAIVLFPVHSTMAQGVGGAFKIGYDFEGDHEVSGYGFSGSEDVETGISLSGELLFHLNSHLDMGFGMTYQIPRSQDEKEVHRTTKFLFRHPRIH